jgi:hypothetical protein
MFLNVTTAIVCAEIKEKKNNKKEKKIKLHYKISIHGIIRLLVYASSDLKIMPMIN